MELDSTLNHFIRKIVLGWWEKMCGFETTEELYKQFIY